MNTDEVSVYVSAPIGQRARWPYGSAHIRIRFFG